MAKTSSRPVGLAAALAAAAFATAAQADLTLANRHNCTGCHQVDQRVVGPAFRDIAKKYAGRAEVAARLVQKIREGGGGQWGPVPMPAQPAVSEADAKALVAWILAGAK